MLSASEVPRLAAVDSPFRPWATGWHAPQTRQQTRSTTALPTSWPTSTATPMSRQHSRSSSTTSARTARRLDLPGSPGTSNISALRLGCRGQIASRLLLAGLHVDQPLSELRLLQSAATYRGTLQREPSWSHCLTAVSVLGPGQNY